MTEDENTTEDRLKNAIEMYDYDSQEWDTAILLDELEFLYSYRETINKLISRFKADILKGLSGSE